MANKKAKKSSKQTSDTEPICQNRKARHDYEILDTLECGIVLHGSEVKSIRDGLVSLEEGFAYIRDGELWLKGCHIGEYSKASFNNHVPLRLRKLLLHKRELRKFAENASQKGLTLVPLGLYFKRGIVKVKLAVGRGRKYHDKRQKLKNDSDKRAIQAAMKNRRR